MSPEFSFAALDPLSVLTFEPKGQGNTDKFRVMLAFGQGLSSSEMFFVRARVGQLRVRLRMFAVIVVPPHTDAQFFKPDTGTSESRSVCRRDPRKCAPFPLVYSR